VIGRLVRKIWSKANSRAQMLNYHTLTSGCSLHAQQIEAIQKAAVEQGKIFEHLMEATKVCTLGQITEALFEVGGQYRRNM
jgi:methylmalonyl-CoA mutase